MNKKTRSPLFHITKRDALPWYKSWGIRAAAILLALIVCSIITTTMTGENPLQVYATIFNGSFGSPRKVWVLLQNIAMLLCIALAVTPAFKMRFWNIGGEGQVLAGALAAAACMICLRNTLPNALVIVCMCVSSILAGALWGFIPAYFKAKYNTNETLFTLMMNYVATQLVAYFVIVWENPKGSGQIGIINQSTEIGWFPQIGSYKYLLNILIVAVVTILMYFYLNYTKHGYEITVVGESERTARYVGIKVDKVIIRTMILSGAVCGLCGLLLVGSTNHRRRARLYRRYGLVARQIQPHLDDLYELPARVPQPRRGRDLHSVRTESVVLRYSHRHHSLLHHRIGVLYHL